MFKLKRYFSVTSAVAIVILTVLLAFFFRQNQVEGLSTLVEGQSLSLSHSLANTIWPKYSKYVNSASEWDGDTLRMRPETQEIHEFVKTITKGLPVLKIKMYSLNGQTVYSSEFSQIGNSKSGNAVFQDVAQRGMPSTKHSFRETFSSFEGIVKNRYLIESYWPIQGPDGRVEGVFELYSDITPQIATIGETTTKVVIYLLIGLGVLYGVLLMIIQRADRILKNQYMDLKHEILERKSAEEKHKMAVEVAEKANLTKSEFLSTMSHELRTPLTASLGSLGLLNSLMSDDLSDEGQELLKVAIRNNRSLLRLVNELLDYDKLLSGTLIFETKKHNICELTEKTVKNLQGYAQTQSVDFVLEKTTSPIYAKVQEHRFEQILNNLLSNAAKFSEPGADVLIDIKCKNERVYVSVKDNGPGIAEELRKKIFEPFVQADSSATRKHSGTGLGLAISKSLAEAMGGEISFETEVGVGSVFSLSLPVTT